MSSRTLGGAASAASISSHGDGLLVLLDVLEEGNSALKLPAVDGLGGLASVLERHSEVGTAGAGRLRGLDLGGSVSNLYEKKKPESAMAHLQNPCHQSHHKHSGFGSMRTFRQKLHQQVRDNSYNMNILLFLMMAIDGGSQLLTISATWVVSDGFDDERGLAGVKLRNSELLP